MTFQKLITIQVTSVRSVLFSTFAFNINTELFLYKVECSHEVHQNKEMLNFIAWLLTVCFGKAMQSETMQGSFQCDFVEK